MGNTQQRPGESERNLEALQAALRERETECRNNRTAIEALHHLSTRYEALLEQVPNLVVETNFAGTCILANQTAIQFFGSTIIGRKLDLKTGSSSNHSEHFESWHIRQDGIKRTIAWVTRIFTDPDGKPAGILATGLDITDDRRAERMLALSAELLTLLNQSDHHANHIDDILHCIHRHIGCTAAGIRVREGDDYPLVASAGLPPELLKTERFIGQRNPDGTPRLGSDRKPQLEGLCGMVISGQTPTDLPIFTAGGSCWIDSSEQLLPLIPKLSNIGVMRLKCLQSRFQSMALIPLRSNGTIIGLLYMADVQSQRFTRESVESLEVMAQSIGIALSRKQVHDSLSTTLERFTSLYNSMQEGVALHEVVRDNTGTIIDYRLIDVNPQYERITGIPRDKATGALASKLYGTKAPPYLESFTRVTITGKPVTMEVYFDPMKIWFLISVVPIGPEQFATVFTDITPHKKQAEELRTANRELNRVVDQLKNTQQTIIQQERLHALGQMALGVAHEFNNLLVPILGLSDLLINTPHLLDNQSETLNMIREIAEAARGARNVIHHMRDAFRETSEQVFAPVNLAETIRRAVETTRPRWSAEMQAHNKTIAIESTIPDDIHVPGINTELRQTFVNLILNAVDAMPEGGTIRLSAQTGDTHACIEVSDNGMGMSDEQRRHCMEPFYTTKGNQGTGLGLALVQGIIKRHNGTLLITSSPGTGTTVTIKLPQIAVPTGTPTTHGISSNLLPVCLRILVIDDEVSSRMVFGRFLKADGHDVHFAHNGETGLSQFKQQSFDMVITDWAMPGVSGTEVVEKIKQSKPQTRVILLTGFGQTTNHHEWPPGVDRILWKPITQRDLRDTIRQLSSPRNDPLTPTA